MSETEQPTEIEDEEIVFEDEELVLEEEEDLGLEFSDLLFNSVEGAEEILLPQTVQDGIFKRQEDTIKIENLKEQIVLKIGCGSVGSHTLTKLNKMGVSAFVIFDPDTVEKHNSTSGVFFYQETKRQEERREWRNYSYYLNGKGGASKSPFKVDIVEGELRRHDPQIFLKTYKARFGVNWKTALSEFRSTCSRLNISQHYDSTGYNASDETFNVDEIEFNNYPSPTCIITTVDSLKARFNSIMSFYLKNEERETPLPLIDSRVVNSLKGEVYCLDMFDKPQLLYYFNSMFETPFDNLEDLITMYKEDKESIPFLNLTLNRCGDEMSVLSSGLSSVLICSLFRLLFKEKAEPNFDKVPYMINFSLTTGHVLPYFNGILWENLRDDLDEVSEDET